MTRLRKLHVLIHVHGTNVLLTRHGGTLVPPRSGNFSRMKNFWRQHCQVIVLVADNGFRQFPGGVVSHACLSQVSIQVNLFGSKLSTTVSPLAVNIYCWHCHTIVWGEGRVSSLYWIFLSFGRIVWTYEMAPHWRHVNKPKFICHQLQSLGKGLPTKRTYV